MGVFDTVIVPCPTCGTNEHFQSKSGPCAMEEYELDDAPPDILQDVNRHSPYTCVDCGTQFMVIVKWVTVAKSVKV